MAELTAVPKPVARRVLILSDWSRDSLACRLYSLALEVWDRPRKEFHFATEKLASSLLTAAGFDLFSLGGESPHTPLLLFLASYFHECSQQLPMGI